MEEKIYALEIVGDEKDYEELVAFLASNAPYGWEEERQEGDHILFRMYGSDLGRLKNLAEAGTRLGAAISCTIKALQNKDWASAWRQFFTPVECGSRFVVLPPWLAHKEHFSRQSVIIDPKNAFGTGHHATTALCLLALSLLLDDGRIGKGDWFLDFGCGSGILGIAACKAGLDGTGLDIDPEAIANARENRELNAIGNLELLVGGIEKIRGSKFDLVMANILARPLMDLASELTAVLKPDGALVLSGILEKQSGEVAPAYGAQGLKMPEILKQDDWVALIWK